MHIFDEKTTDASDPAIGGHIIYIDHLVLSNGTLLFRLFSIYTKYSKDAIELSFKWYLPTIGIWWSMSRGFKTHWIHVESTIYIYIYIYLNNANYIYIYLSRQTRFVVGLGDI